MNGALRPNTMVFAGLGALCLIASIIAMLALDGESASEAEGAPAPLAAGLDQASDGLVASVVTGAGRSRDLARARNLSWSALREAPCDTGAWLRLAEIDSLSTGRPGKAGLRALRNSYRVAPLDPYQAFWRTRFSLENWQWLPADLKQSADREVAGLAASAPHRLNLARTLAHIANPRGAMVASLWIHIYKLPLTTTGN